MTHFAISVDTTNISEMQRRQMQRRLFPKTTALIVLGSDGCLVITPEHPVSDDAYMQAEETIRKMVPGADITLAPAQIRPLGPIYTC